MKRRRKKKQQQEVDQLGEQQLEQPPPPLSPSAVGNFSRAIQLHQVKSELLMMVIVPWLLTIGLVLLFAPIASMALGICLVNYLIQVIARWSDKALHVCDCNP